MVAAAMPDSRGELAMKPAYSKPVFAKREKLSQVVAVASPPPTGNAS
jgi:hypothetical protein